jgi:hypothetical protein|tara:strand:- start:240 stop:497 length:258 start_codon:yes stop_codon:yes gene_type:complete
MSLYKAEIEIKKILLECEADNESFDVTLGKLNGIKVLGHVFPTLMLIAIMDKFSEGYESRQKKYFNGEEDIQGAYDAAAIKWNNR